MEQERSRGCHRSDDAALMKRLARELAAADPPPPELEALAGELLTWQTIDAELDALSRRGLMQTPTGLD